MEREWLWRLRLDAGMSGTDVAKICGISQAEYSRIETGNRTPRPALAQTLGRVLGFDWRLFYEEGVA